MNLEVGDIWQWDHKWTVLLTKRLPNEDWEGAPVYFMGIALEDGWHGRWEFGDKINQLWEKLV